MKANRGQVERALDKPTPEIRLILLYGPDESGSHALAGRIAKAFGPDAERIDLSGASLKGDPARLADEAASISLFGGARHIRVEPAGDEVLDAVDALIEASSAGNPVVIVAGALRKDSKLVKRCLDAPAALAFASYLPEGRDADQMVRDAAREAGLEIAPDVARRLGAATGGDRMILAQEIEKLALFLDAAPDRRRDVAHDTLDSLLADSGEASLGTLVDAALDGRADAAARVMGRLAVEGIAGVPVLVAVEKRLLLLATLRAEVEAGNAVARVMEGAGRALFWRDKEVVSRQLGRWTGEALRAAIGRVIAAKRLVMQGRGPGPVGAEAEILAIARHAARLGR